MKSHLISQVLLKRFAINNKIRVNSKYSILDYSLDLPSKLAYVEVPERFFSKLERKYGSSETRMATAFVALDNGTLLTNSTYVQSVKNFMVLHYVRSRALLHLVGNTEVKHFDKFIEEIKINHPEKILNENEKQVLRNQWKLDLITKSIPNLITSTMKKVEPYVSQYDLEIGLAPQEISFVLGDVATLNFSKDERFGFLEGVPIDRSDGFAMPLGPKHLVALITSNKSINYKKLTTQEVGNCNQKIIKNSLFEYYTLP